MQRKFIVKDVCVTCGYSVLDLQLCVLFSCFSDVTSVLGRIVITLAILEDEEYIIFD